MSSNTHIHNTKPSHRHPQTRPLANQYATLAIHGPPFQRAAPSAVHWPAVLQTTHPSLSRYGTGRPSPQHHLSHPTIILTSQPITARVSLPSTAAGPSCHPMRVRPHYRARLGAVDAYTWRSVAGFGSTLAITRGLGRADDGGMGTLFPDRAAADWTARTSLDWLDRSCV